MRQKASSRGAIACRKYAATVVTAALLLSSTVFESSAAESSRQATEDTFDHELLPLLRTYCFDCHGRDDASGEIALEADSNPTAMAANRDQWMHAIAQLRIGTMPPDDGETLDQTTRARLVELIERVANHVDCVRPVNAGKVALRRLNRDEYRNTIFDLTGVNYKPATRFPGDDVGYGFDNIGDVLSLPPLLMEKYLDAAEAIVGEAIFTPPPAQILAIDRAPSSLIGAEKFGGKGRLTMASNGTVALQVDAPFPGQYQFTVTASGDQAGNEPVKMEVRAGRSRRVIEVSSTDPKPYSLEFRLGPGDRKFEISFINDFYQPGSGDRNLHLHHVSVRGEQTRSALASRGELPASHRQIIFVEPDGDLGVEQATTAVLSRFASRAFRRPATADEVNRLAALAADVRSGGGSYEEGIQVAMQAVLVSPHFLFKVEQPRPLGADGTMPPINDFELATRISYFLWSSMPDDELFGLAHRGELRNRRKLLGKIASMMRDRRSNQFVENFAGQWLQLRNLDNVEPDTRRFRRFNDELRELMRRETLTFFAGVMRENLPVTRLLDADFTYLNEPLARFYDIQGVEGDQFRKVDLAGTPRGGLLTHASMLTVTSNPTRTSPVKRGKWILENLLGTPPPPAPPNVPELERGRLVGTLRERMEQHRDNPACASCHSVMDPLGFALENFDAIGQWRNRDGRDEINASGKLPDGTEFTGAGELKQVLSTERQQQFVRCLAEKLLIYAIGRGTEYYDRCAIDQIVETAKQHDYEFAYLIAAIIASEPFQKQGTRE